MSDSTKKSAGSIPTSQLRSLAQHCRDTGPTVVMVLLGVVVLGGLAILPARTWMSQRDAMAVTEAELTGIEGQVAELDAQLNLLQTDAEIERQARENYDLVYPGEESYRILPAPAND